MHLPTHSQSFRGQREWPVSGDTAVQEKPTIDYVAQSWQFSRFEAGLTAGIRQHDANQAELGAEWPISGPQQGLDRHGHLTTFIRHKRQALAHEGVDHGQHAEPTAATRCVADKVHGPAPVRRLRQRHRRPRSHVSLAAGSLPHTQDILTIQPQRLFVIYEDAFSRQHDPKPPIAKPTPFQRDLAKRRPPVAIIGSPMRIAHRRL